MQINDKYSESVARNRYQLLPVLLEYVTPGTRDTEISERSEEACRGTRQFNCGQVREHVSIHLKLRVECERDLTVITSSRFTPILVCCL